MQLDAPALILYSRDYYLLEEHEEQRKAYKELLLEILELLGVPEELSQKDVEELLAFEVAFANVRLDGLVDSRFPSRSRDLVSNLAGYLTGSRTP